MIGFLVFILTVTIVSSLQPMTEVSSDEEIKQILTKYVNKIPDLQPKYILNNGLNKLISKYYNKKINTFPLYKITLKIDRKPVKIPWTLGAPANTNGTGSGQKYKYVRIRKEKTPPILRENQPEDSDEKQSDTK